MKINEALKICFSNDIKVYPVVNGKFHQIEYSQKDVIKKKYSKILKTPKTLDEAMRKTYIFLAKKIQEKK